MEISLLFIYNFQLKGYKILGVDDKRKVFILKVKQITSQQIMRISLRDKKGLSRTGLTGGKNA